MREKILTTFSFVYVLILFSHITLAETRIYTNIEIENGSGVFEQKVNNETLRIEINRTKATVQSNVTDSNITYSVNATGTGEVKVKSDSKEYELNVSSDSARDRFSGKGNFKGVFSFVKNLLISGWVIFENIISI